MQAHRRSQNNVGAYQLEYLCLYASFLKWCKVATYILSINVALSSTYDVFTLLSISWNVIAILLCFTQPYLMALVLVTTICYFGHFIAYSLICYVGSRKYLSFHNMFRWVSEIRSQDSILSTLLPAPTDNRMWRSIIAAHIVNTKTECTGNKLDRNDSTLLAMFETRTNEQGEMIFVLKDVDIFQCVNQMCPFIFVPSELHVNFAVDSHDIEMDEFAGND